MSAFGVFLLVFSCIRTEYGEIQSNCSPYSVQVQENADHENSEYGHFSRSVMLTRYWKNDKFSAWNRFYLKESILIIRNELQTRLRTLIYNWHWTIIHYYCSYYCYYQEYLQFIIAILPLMSWQTCFFNKTSDFKAYVKYFFDIIKWTLFCKSINIPHIIIGLKLIWRTYLNMFDFNGKTIWWKILF